MRIEEPAWTYTIDDKENVIDLRVVWTNDPDLEGQDGFIYKYRYLPSVVMHEFGHTAGLTDLYKHTGYDDYLMDFTYGATAIPQEDIDYIQQVYRNEHSSEPH